MLVSCSPYQGQLGNEEFLYFRDDRHSPVIPWDPEEGDVEENVVGVHILLTVKGKLSLTVRSGIFPYSSKPLSFLNHFFSNELYA